MSALAKDLNMNPRDPLLKAIQDYAQEWKEGKSTIQSPAKTALYIALDRYDFRFLSRIKEQKDIVDMLKQEKCNLEAEVESLITENQFLEDQLIRL